VLIRAAAAGPITAGRPSWDKQEQIDIAKCQGLLNSAIYWIYGEQEQPNFTGNHAIITLGIHYKLLAELAGITRKAGQ